MRAKCGYTLMEIMIALFIFTLVALVATKGLHTVMITQSATENKAEDLRELQMALLLFSRDLSQALDASLITADRSEKKHELNFWGKAQELKFTSLLLAQEAENGQPSHLTPHHYTFKAGQWWREKRLLQNGLSALQYRYLDKKKHFHQQWPPQNGEDNETHLPLAVEVTLTFKNQAQIKQLYLLPQQEMPHAPQS